MKETNVSAAAEKKIKREQYSQLPLVRRNFLLMIIAGVMIVLGFVLMVGGGAGENEFNPAIFSTVRIVVGPTIAFLGFVLMGVAIIIKPAKGKHED